MFYQFLCLNRSSTANKATAATAFTNPANNSYPCPAERLPHQTTLHGKIQELVQQVKTVSHRNAKRHFDVEFYAQRRRAKPTTVLAMP